MKHPLRFASLTLGGLLLLACAEEAVDTSGSSGSGATAGSGGSSGSAGKSGSSGQAGAGGGSGSGGTSAAGTAGTAGSGGDAGAGGTGQSGSGGSGGTGQSGAGGDAGAGGTGQSGSGGTGQSGSGGTGQSGSGGSGGTGQSGSGGSGGTGQSGSGGSSGTGSGGNGPTIPAEAVELCQLLNAYRQEQGLPAIPLSTALMTVAAYHVQDLIAQPSLANPPCNLHSWSSNEPLWTGCCYTSDHAQAACMWEKPGQITASWGANTYKGYGYENSAAGVSTPQGALESWKKSPAHHDVILNKGIWASKAPWPAVGCGLSGGYAVLWFGDAVDPQPFNP
ncbi:MAG: CAP domain-containing protein [Polyangiaceae bacterium]|nr:CAP domain-containing protein [Polyangiaceae bacterium]